MAPLPTTPARLFTALAVAASMAACADAPTEDIGQEPPAADTTAMALGPIDGRELPGEALARVAVGDLAPDFTLASHGGDRVRLSGFRGEKTVLLVFYRGHW